MNLNLEGLFFGDYTSSLAVSTEALEIKKIRNEIHISYELKCMHHIGSTVHVPFLFLSTTFSILAIACPRFHTQLTAMIS